MVSIVVIGVMLVVAFIVATRLMGGESSQDRRAQDAGTSGYASGDGGYADSGGHDRSHDSNEDGSSGDGGGDSGGGDGGGGGD